MNERDLFIAALQMENLAERQAYLDAACVGQPELRAQVEGLLRLYEHAGSFLEQPAVDAGATGAYLPTPEEHRPTAEVSGTLIGPYKLLQQIGEGGMGTVWMAEQIQPLQRKVAVKIIKPGLDSHQILARFEAERQALALMDHPHIAKVFDAGTTDTGRPYFVMELVKGQPITKYCDEHRLTPRQRLELFVPVCQAIQHAHQKGIIHRDVKPGNVLVAPYDGRPVVKVIDFGVAKATGQQLTDKTLFTEFGAVVGTLEYMSPEQAELNNQDVDTRSDIYSLGVLLYELLTGTTPLDRKRFQAGAILELLRIIREEEPPKPSTRLSDAKDSLPSISAQRHMEPAKLTRLVRGELDWIVMKALEKDRNRRYETANGFAMDVRRYLSDEPVAACPPSTAYRLRKFVKRNKGPVVAASLVLLALLGGMAGTTWGFLREAERAEGEKLAKQEALAAAEAEKKANAQAQQRLAQIKKGNDIITSIFTDLNIREVKKGTEPLEAILAQRLVKAAEQLEGEAIGDPLVVAELQDRLGQSLLSLGHSQEAIPLFVKARATRAASLGADHPDTLISMANLAAGYQAAGKLELALPLLEETLKLMKAKLGPEHPDTLVSMNNLAGAYQDAGKFDLALTLHEETLRLQKAKLGPEHPDTLHSMNNLALAYQNAGKFDLALTLLEETLKLRKAKLGADHLGTLHSMGNLAAGYQAAGKFDLALTLLEETLRLQKAKLGANHPDTLHSMSNLAAAYWWAKQLDKSIPLFEETLKRREAKLGREHPDTLGTVANLGVNYKDAGRLAEAVPLLEEAFRAAKKFPELRGVGGQLQDAYAKTGEHAKLATLLKEQLAEARTALPKDSPQLAGLLAQIGSSLLEQKQWTEAEPLLGECLAIREKKEPDAWTTFNTKSMLGGSLLGQKKYAEAEPLLLAGYQGLKEREPKIQAISKVRLTEALERLVQLYEATGQKEKAAEWHKTLEARRASDKKAEKPKEK